MHNVDHLTNNEPHFYNLPENYRRNIVRFCVGNRKYQRTTTSFNWI